MLLAFSSSGATNRETKPSGTARRTKITIDSGTLVFTSEPPVKDVPTVGFEPTTSEVITLCALAVGAT